jgi:H+/Cl- antiporter ClcA/CBS domain-containing protein
VSVKYGSPSPEAEDRLDDRLADFTRDRRMIVLSAMALVIGAASAGVAYILVQLIAVIGNLAFFGRWSTAAISPENHRLGLFVVFVPVVGGLLIGLLARYGSEKIRGHGIPEALEAILVGRSRMDVKVAVLKPLSSAISIGTGGPFGAEGPIIMTGGALGSLFAQLFHLSSAERKTLLVAGAAGGMAAIFAAPIASVLLAVELLLFEWKPRSFIPVAIAAATAGALRRPLLGYGAIFPVTPHAELGVWALVFAFAVGIVAGVASGALTRLVYLCEDLFEKLPVHWMWWPAIGGLVVGLGGLVEPRVLGVGYDVIHGLLRGDLVVAALLGLLLVKAVVWSVALGSGTSGGVLAPLLIMGGALGAIEAHWIPVGDSGLWATLGMAAMMGGTMRSPLTAIVFTLELTHDLNVLPGLLVSCIAAHAFTVLVLRRSILTEKIARRGYHLTREYTVDLLSIVRVGEVMDRNAPTIVATTTLAELSDRIARADPVLARRQGTMIVDADGRLCGVVTRGDLLRAIDGDPTRTVLEVGSRDLVVTYPDEILHDAVARMLEHDVGRLPVVSRSNERELLGYLGRSSLLSARLRFIDEEQVRESAWTRRTSRHTAGAA